MAKLKISEMTPEQIAERHAKAKQRRSNRRANYREAALKIIEALGDKYDTMDDTVKHMLTVLAGEYKPAQKVQCREGDKLIELLQKYANVKDVYKKLQKWCDDNGLKIDTKTATIVKA